MHLSIPRYRCKLLYVKFEKNGLSYTALSAGLLPSNSPLLIVKGVREVDDLVEGNLQN